mmetsp:Transcript_57834/g.136049  ORF Transcript_57834/g.136049 Transcript_57834/m.136049 type:complete len:268 (-) Transcript_57834:285-1088(-)
MDVQLTVVRQVVVDHQRDLAHVEPARPDVGGDEHARGARPELLHDRLAVVLGHVAVHGGDREVRLAHLVREPVDLPLRVAEDHSLRDRERVVEVAQRVELPLLALHRHEKLLDPLQRELVALHQDADRVRHELLGHLEHLPWQRRGNQEHLDLRRQVAVHVVDLLLETLVEHLVGLVEDERLDVARPQIPPPDHVEHAARGSRNDVHAVVELPDVIADALPSNARVRLHLHVVADSKDHLLRLRRKLPGGVHDEDLDFALCCIDELE